MSERSHPILRTASRAERSSALVPRALTTVPRALTLVPRALALVPRGLAVLLVRAYQRGLSPLLAVLFRSSGCRFQPTCSEYAAEAISRFGVLRGGLMALRRLGRCHPFHPGGYDPPQVRSL